MSFLTRIAMRAGIPGVAAAEPILVSKDRGVGRPQGLSRQEVESEEGEEVHTLRRQADTGSEEEEVETLRRQAEPEEESEEAARAAMVPPASEEEGVEAQAARRAAAGAPEEEEEAQPARRVARIADREAQAIRRMAPTEDDEENTVASSRIDPAVAEQENEEAQPVRRVEEDEEEDPSARPLLRSAGAWRAVRHAPAPGPEELGPESSPAPAIVSDEPEPSDLRALGETSPMPAPAPPSAPIPTAHGPDHAGWAAEASMPVLPPQAFAEKFGAPSEGRLERPQVVIDRVDVLIHEAMPPARAPESDKRRARSFRARYLRRL